jgi:cell division protein FtsB
VSQPPPPAQRPPEARPADAGGSAGPGAGSAGPGAAGPGARLSGSKPHFTGRAAVLAVVLCAIALSLAYPVREYISQRKQIDELQAQSEQIWLHRKYLQHEDKLLHEPRYIAQLARDRLHMCWPTQSCYIIIGRTAKPKHGAAPPAPSPWYARMWSSVQTANSDPVKRAKTQAHSRIRAHSRSRGLAHLRGDRSGGAHSR